MLTEFHWALCRCLWFSCFKRMNTKKNWIKQQCHDVKYKLYKIQREKNSFARTHTHWFLTHSLGLRLVFWKNDCIGKKQNSFNTYKYRFICLIASLFFPPLSLFCKCIHWSNTAFRSHNKQHVIIFAVQFKHPNYWCWTIDTHGNKPYKLQMKLFYSSCY